MVRRYCFTLDQDYTKHKITVCIHIDKILDLYMNQRKPFMRTYADQLERQRQQRYSSQNRLDQVLPSEVNQSLKIGQLDPELSN